MGYRPSRTVVKLDFSQTEMTGLEVTMRVTSIGTLLEWQQVADVPDPDTMQEVLAEFADHLIGWNVEDDSGDPVPATLAGVLSQEPFFVQQVIGAYAREISKAPPPLPLGSASGVTSPVPDLNLAGSSVSLPSL